MAFWICIRNSYSATVSATHVLVYVLFELWNFLFCCDVWIAQYFKTYLVFIVELVVSYFSWKEKLPIRNNAVKLHRTTSNLVIRLGEKNEELSVIVEMWK